MCVHVPLVFAWYVVAAHMRWLPRSSIPLPCVCGVYVHSFSVACSVFCLFSACSCVGRCPQWRWFNHVVFRGNDGLRSVCVR